MSLNAAATAPNRPRILLVDDEEAILNSLRRLFRQDGYEIDAMTQPMQALSLVTSNSYELVISDMRMPEMDGASFLQAVATYSPHTMRLLLTGYADQEATVRAINLGRIHGYLRKPWDNQQLREQVAKCLTSKAESDKQRTMTQKLQKLSRGLTRDNLNLENRIKSISSELEQTASFLDCAYQELKDNFNAMIQVLAQIVRARLPEDIQEINNLIVVQCEELLKRVDASPDVQTSIQHAAMLCQIGKLALPDRLLSQPYTALSPHDRKLFLEYPLHAERWLFPVSALSNVARIIRHQHENFDGSGGPDKLKGQNIPLGSRLLKIVLDFNMMVAGKIDPLLAAPDNASKCLRMHAGTVYDPDLVEIYLDVLHELAHYDEMRGACVVRTDELRDGMVLARDLVSFDGMLLLVRGTEMHHNMIVRLREWEQQHRAPLNVVIRSE